MVQAPRRTQVPSWMVIEHQMRESLSAAARALWNVPSSAERTAMRVRLEAFWSVLSSWSWRPPSAELRRFSYERAVALPQEVRDLVGEGERVTQPMLLVV